MASSLFQVETDKRDTTTATTTSSSSSSSSSSAIPSHDQLDSAHLLPPTEAAPTPTPTPTRRTSSSLHAPRTKRGVFPFLTFVGTSFQDTVASSPKRSKYPLRTFHIPLLKPKSTPLSHPFPPTRRQQQQQQQQHLDTTATPTEVTSMGNQVCSGMEGPSAVGRNVLISETSLSSMETQECSQQAFPPKNFFFLPFQQHQQRGKATEQHDDRDDTTTTATLPSEGSATAVATTTATDPIHQSNPFVRLIGSAIHHVGNFVRDVFQEPPAPPPPPRRVRGGILLYGCNDVEQHFEKHDDILERMKAKHGLEGLLEAGLFYQRVPCDQQNDGSSLLRLSHMDSQTIVSSRNRRQFVADGLMYDEVARCCMEYAQELMIEEGDLEWITIDDTVEPPIRALVSRRLPTSLQRPTLLVVTGRGKVRAGIFSRQHIQVTGLEPSSALSIVAEAKQRNLNIILLDPNVHTDKKAIVTIEKSMAKLFGHVEQSNGSITTGMYPLYVQAHSCAGSYIVRYLMDKYDKYQRHLQAIVFTDSTHNVQWLSNSKTKDDVTCQALKEFVQGPRCVYYRSCRRDEPQEAGTSFEHDENWTHRFGSICTYWAGTTEHSLSDWHARRCIWQHLDTYLE